MSRPAVNEILISAVMPVYNEVGVLPQLLRRVRRRDQAHRRRAEIVFVNDGSHDGSTEILDKLAADHAEVRVIHLSRNFGHQAAIHAGLAHVATARSSC